MIREMELLFQASRTSPMLHEAAVTVEEGIAALRTERDELVIQNERLGNDIVAAEARCARLQQTLADANEARRGIIAACIAVKGKLDAPYPDDNRWTPWQRFIEPALRRLDEALAGPDTPADKELCPGCGGDAGDNHFDRILCHCGDGSGAMHTYCNTCGYALDGCDFQPDITPADSQEDKT